MSMKMYEPQYYLFRVISGGQTGADQGGLEAAYGLGVETGGHAPLGWRTSRGPNPGLATYGLVEHTSFGYAQRTEVNVRNADGTAIIGTRSQSPGSRLTHRLCVKHSKPCKEIWLHEQYTNDEIMHHAKELANWMRKKKIAVLNVAGNRDEYASYLHFHMTFKLIQCALLDLYSTGELMVPELQ